MSLAADLLEGEGPLHGRVRVALVPLERRSHLRAARASLSRSYPTVSALTFRCEDCVFFLICACAKMHVRCENAFFSPRRTGQSELCSSITYRVILKMKEHVELGINPSVNSLSQISPTVRKIDSEKNKKIEVVHRIA